MTKLQIWNEVQEILNNHKSVTKAMRQELEDVLAPKNGGGQTNPPKEVDGVMNYYCRFHQAYEPLENMVMSAGKSKGYCRASISKWNKTNSNIKKLDAEVSKLVGEGDFEGAQAKVHVVEEFKAMLNNPKSYDLEKDWEDFNA